MRSVEDLFEEAKWGKLTNEEIAYVAQRIESSTPGNDDDLYKLIYILGRIQAKQYRKLLERFLYYPSDPMISEAALYALCGQMECAKDYLHEIKTFIKGVEWDEGEQVRLKAISCAGQFLRHNPKPDKKLLELLIHVFEHPEDTQSKFEWNDPVFERENAEIFREAAFIALARALGMEWNQLVGTEDRELILEQDFILAIVEKARQKVRELEQSEKRKK